MTNSSLIGVFGDCTAVQRQAIVDAVALDNQREADVAAAVVEVALRALTIAPPDLGSYRCNGSYRMPTPADPR